MRAVRSFFDRSAREVARDLLGWKPVRLEDGGEFLSGVIVETEAYLGPEDRGVALSTPPGLAPNS